jgi:Flp pilus assembly pilin Flp
VLTALLGGVLGVVWFVRAHGARFAAIRLAHAVQQPSVLRQPLDTASPAARLPYGVAMAIALAITAWSLRHRNAHRVPPMQSSTRLRVFTTRFARRERGAAAVEFALVAPVLLILVFGVIDFGRALYVVNVLTAAMREGRAPGCRVGCQLLDQHARPFVHHGAEGSVPGCAGLRLDRL